MHSRNHIRYLRRQEIDTSRWDACVAAAPNSLIYGRSFYLDAMTAGQWDALVLDDYQAVMPLTWRRRAGIRYLYQPAFTQQGGVFAPGDLSPALLASFLDELGHHFRFAEIFLNYANPVITEASPAGPADPFTQTRTNFILPLDKPYPQLAAQYKKDLVRNLPIAARAELNYGKEADLQSVLDGYRREYEDRLPHVKEEEYRRFEKLCFACQKTGQLLIRIATDPRQQRLATALLLLDTAPPASPAPPARHPSRMYLLQSTTTPAGRDLAANHFLLDGLVKEWAGHPRILDFEGSEVPGIAHFYRNFGSHDQPYFYYRYNKLPWPLRLLKK